MAKFVVNGYVTTKLPFLTLVDAESEADAAKKVSKSYGDAAIESNEDHAQIMVTVEVSECVEVVEGKRHGQVEG